MKIIYNNKLINKESLIISPLSQGFSYGVGFFTTIKVTNRKPENLDLHLERIIKSLNYFSFAITVPPLESLINILLTENSIENARVKVTFFKDISKISYIISCEPLPVLNSPIELTISDYIRGNEPIHRYKTLNYYQNLISGESIIKDHKNRILETGYANIFVQLEDKIFTPPAYLPILPGTFRQYLLNMGEYNGYKIMEKELFVEDIDLFDKVYITNSLRGIIPISKIIR